MGQSGTIVYSCLCESLILVVLQVAECVRDLEKRLARFNIKSHRKLTSRYVHVHHVIPCALCHHFHPLERQMSFVVPFPDQG